MIRNSIYCNDAVETMHSWPDESVDLFIYSPPYDSIRSYQGYTLNLLTLGEQCYRTLKSGGICAMVIQDGTKNFAKSLTSFRTTVDYVDKVGFRLFECVIYYRAGRPGKWWNQRFRVDHEYVMLFLKGDRPKYFNKESLKVPAKYAGHIWSGTQRHTNGDLTPIKRTEQKALRCPGTVWNIGPSTAEHNKLKMQHPATMPDKLAEDLILCFSQPGELVVDPLCGSGTTLRMARKHQRDFIGIDISLEYCQLAQKGLENGS
jgi:DNA modification methylase